MKEHRHESILLIFFIVFSFIFLCSFILDSHCYQFGLTCLFPLHHAGTQYLTILHRKAWGRSDPPHLGAKHLDLEPRSLRPSSIYHEQQNRLHLRATHCLPWITTYISTTTPTFFLTSYEAKRSTLWWSGSTWVDFQNYTVLWLSMCSRCRTTYSHFVLYGWTCFILVLMDVEEWLPNIMVHHASSSWILLRSVVLQRPSGSDFQTPATRNN